MTGLGSSRGNRPPESVLRTTSYVACQGAYQNGVYNSGGACIMPSFFLYQSNSTSYSPIQYKPTMFFLWIQKLSRTELCSWVKERLRTLSVRGLNSGKPSKEKNKARLGFAPLASLLTHFSSCLNLDMPLNWASMSTCVKLDRKCPILCTQKNLPLEAVYPEHLHDNDYVMDAYTGVILINIKWNNMANIYSGNSGKTGLKKMQKMHTFSPPWNKAYFHSVQFSRSVVPDSLRPHEPQHARPPCPLPTARVYPNPCPLSRWCRPTSSSSVVPFSSCPQSFPASGSFSVSQLFM